MKRTKACAAKSMSFLTILQPLALEEVVLVLVRKHPPLVWAKDAIDAVTLPITSLQVNEICRAY